MIKDGAQITTNYSSSLLKTATFLLENIKDEEIKMCPNRLAYILSISAFIEAKLNEAIIHWGNIDSDFNQSQKHATSFLSMNLRAKLDTIFYIYTDGEYITNYDSKEYQAIANLITIRNQVAHSKPYSISVDIELKENDDGSVDFNLPDNYAEKSELKANKLTLEKLSFLLHSAQELDQALDYNDSFKTSRICEKALDQRLNSSSKCNT